MKNFSRIFWGNVLLLLAVAFGLWLAKYGVKVSDRYAKHVGVVVITTADATPLACPAPVVDVTSKDSSARCNMECEVAGNKVTCEPKYQPDWCVIDANSKACACQTDKESDACTGKDSRPLCEREPNNLDCVCANVDKARTKQCLCRDPKSQAEVCKEVPPVEIKCSTDQKLVKGKCVDKPLTCAADEELVKGKCVTKELTCGEGKKLVKSACVDDEVKIVEAPAPAPALVPKVQPCDAKINVKFDTGSLSMNATLFGQDLFSKLYEDATEEGEFGNAAMFRFCPAVKDKFGRADLRVDKKVDGELKMIWCSDDPEYCENVEFQIIDTAGKASEWRKLKEVKIDNDLYYGGVSRKMYHFF